MQKMVHSQVQNVCRAVFEFSHGRGRQQEEVFKELECQIADFEANVECCVSEAVIPRNRVAKMDVKLNGNAF